MRDVVENTPKLRFPGFSGEWKPMPVGDFATFQRGFDLPNQSRIEGDVPIVSSGGVSGFHNEAKVERAGLVTGRYGSIGELFYLDGPHWPLNTSLWVKDFHGNEIKFAYYLLSRIDFRSLSDKTGVPGVNRNDVHKLQTAKPKLPEQQKIAAFLGAVDEKIGQLTRKKALLEDYKKGCMQQLFTQKLRFKDDQGNDFPDWEEKKLGDVCEINPRSSALPEVFLYIDLESVSQGQLAAAKLVEKRDAPSRAQRLLEPQDILFQLVRPYQKNNYFFDNPKIHVASTGYAQLRASKNPFFLFQLVHEQGFVNRVLERCTGTNYPAINSNDLAKVAIRIPHPDEQQKIADFLSAIDAKISLVADELSAAQNFKKGLLQQMFV